MEGYRININKVHLRSCTGGSTNRATVLSVKRKRPSAKGPTGYCRADYAALKKS